MMKAFFKYLAENKETIAAVLAGLSTIMATFTGYTSNQLSGSASKNYNLVIQDLLKSNSAYMEYDQIYNTVDLLKMRVLLNDHLNEDDQDYLESYDDELDATETSFRDHAVKAEQSATLAQGFGNYSDKLALMAVLFAVVIFFTSMVSISRSKKIQLAYFYLSISLFIGLCIAVVFLYNISPFI